MFTPAGNCCVACRQLFFLEKRHRFGHYANVVNTIYRLNPNVSYKSFCLIFRKSKMKVDKYVN